MRRMTSTAWAVVAAGTLLGWLTMGRLTTDVRAQDKGAVQQTPAGFPAQDEVQRIYDEADLNRAVEAYRFFYATVSGAAILKGNNEVGVVENKVFGILDTKPRHVGFTLNSDTPYGPIQLDLSAGPLVVELPAGPLIGAALDINQRWVADMGIPGPDAGQRRQAPHPPAGLSGQGSRRLSRLEVPRRIA